MASGIVKYMVDYIKYVLRYCLAGVCEICTAILPDIHVLGSLRTIFLKLTYLLTPWSRVLLEKLTSKLCS